MALAPVTYLVAARMVAPGFYDGLPDPSYVYQSRTAAGPWANIGSSQQAQFWTVQPASPVKTLGYFAAGYPANAISQSTSGNLLLPVVVALLIIAVLVAGIPLGVLRRRRSAGGADDELNQ